MRWFVVATLVTLGCGGNETVPPDEVACESTNDCADGFRCAVDDDDPALPDDRQGSFCFQLCGVGREPCAVDQRCDGDVCIDGDGTPEVLVTVGSCFATVRCGVSIDIGPGSGQVGIIELDFGDGASETFDPGSPYRVEDGAFVQVTIDHVFEQPGQYRVAATAHDANGLDASDAFEVEVPPPL